MRKFLLGLIALAGVVAMSDSASARERQFLFLAWDDGRPEYVQPQAQPAQPQQQYYYQEERPNLFQRLWDMEQRKNAWLRRTFFGQ
ncbi:MAG: hypothetical protein FJ302_01425 [Planctomycetes bacterium]|nr:hypothetical protein [Planctomycetota bacterium]